MNAQDIAAALIAAPRLTYDSLEPLREFRSAKRRTGAPVDLESEVVHAAEKYMESVETLREYLTRAEKEAKEALESMATGDQYVLHRTWFQLDNRVNAERLAATAADRHRMLLSALDLWTTLESRIVATPADVARMAEDARVAAEATAAKPARRKKAA